MAQAEDGIRNDLVTGVQTCALPIMIVLHEDNRTGGIAGEVAAVINERAFDSLDAPIVRICAKDTPAPFSPPLEKWFLPKIGRASCRERVDSLDVAGAGDQTTGMRSA